MLSGFLCVSAAVMGGVQGDGLELTYEKSGFLETGRYAEAVSFCNELAKRSKRAKVVKYGVSPQGREMVALILSENPDGVWKGKPGDGRKKPVIFVQNGIHSGEIEGKDACLMLAREIALPTRQPRYAAGIENILKRADLVILPVLSVDAHERMSPYNRINQNGPKEMGWRVTAQNLNLNRDYVKADAMEMRAELVLINKLDPDFFIDNHTTDGGDWQYVVQYDVPLYPSISQPVVDWSVKYLDAVLPQVDGDGFLTAPYFGGISQTAESPTIRSDVFGPRYSTSYMSLRGTPSLLVETHVLKDYKTRVMGTLSANRRTWEYCASESDGLLEARRAARAEGRSVRPGTEAALGARVGSGSVPWIYKGYEYRPYQSDVTGGQIPAWTKTKVEKAGKWMNTFEPTGLVKVPALYVVPQEMKETIALLNLHGVESWAAESDRRAEATVTLFDQVTFATAPFEGRFMPRYKAIEKVLPVTVKKGDVIVSTAQPLWRLVIHLLEPSAVDSLVNWGFFNGFFEQKEYAESYAMEPYARKMLESDPRLKAEFEKKLAEDADFAKNPGARLDWFFQRSPYFDERLNRYPIVKMMTGEPLLKRGR